MEILKQYLNARKRVLDFFDYDGDQLPITDATNKYWFTASNYVVYSDVPLTAEVIRNGKEICCTENHNTYPSGGYVLLDSNSCSLMVFDDGKRCRDKAVIDLWRECW